MAVQGDAEPTHPLQVQPQLPHTSSKADDTEQLLDAAAEELHQQNLKFEASNVSVLGTQDQLRGATMAAAQAALKNVCQSSELKFLHHCSEEAAVHAHQALIDSVYASQGMNAEAIAVNASLRQISGILMAHPFSMISAGVYEGIMLFPLLWAYCSAMALAQVAQPPLVTEVCNCL